MRIVDDVELVLWRERRWRTRQAASGEGGHEALSGWVQRREHPSDYRFILPDQRSTNRLDSKNRVSHQNEIIGKYRAIHELHPLAGLAIAHPQRRWGGDPMPDRVGTRDARQWASNMLPVVDDIRHQGASTLQEIADALNARGISALRGGAWTSMQVWRLLRQATDGSPPERR